MADKKLIAELEVQTGRSRQNLHDITEELSQQGEAGVRNANAITNALQNIENSTGNVIRKEQEGRIVTERDGKIILQQYEVLEAAVRRFAAAGGEVGPQLEQSLATARSQFDLAREKIAASSAAVHQQKETLQEGGVAWTGIGDQVNKALGRFGGIQVGILAASAALREGIQIGTQFAHAIGTDFQAAESASHALKASIAGVTNALVTDGLFAAMEHGQAVLNNLNDTITGSGKAMDGYNAIVRVGIDRAAALKVSTQDLAAVADVYKLAQEGGTAGLALFNETVRKSNLGDLARDLDALKTKFHELSIEEVVTKTNQEAHAEAIVHAIEAIKNHIKALEAEREAHRLHADDLAAEILELQALKKAQEGDAEAARLATNVHGGLTDAMRQELQRLLELIPHHEQNTEAIKRWVKALEDDVALHRDALDPANVKHLEQMIEMIKALGTSADANGVMTESMIRSTLATADSTDKQGKQVKLVKDSQGHWVLLNKEVEDHEKKIIKVNGVYTNLLDEAKGFPGVNKQLGKSEDALKKVNIAAVELGKEPGGGFTVASSSVKKLADQLPDFDSALDRTRDKLRQIEEQALRTATSITSVGQAASAAATGGGAAPAAPPDDQGLGDIGRGMATGGI